MRRSGPSRLRLRRRLIVFSAPAVIVMLVAVIKLISVLTAGTAAVSDFAGRDIDALRDDIASMTSLIEPDTVLFARGDLAALEGNLDDAESRFSDLLARGDGTRACPVRVNLELIRETQGDIAAFDGSLPAAEERYNSALSVIADAPPRCFEGNEDPDQDRRAVRNDAAARLLYKIDNLGSPLFAPPPPPLPAPPPSAPADAGGDPGGGSDVNPDALPGDAPLPELRLEPGVGNPVERLQEALGDADAAGG